MFTSRRVFWLLFALVVIALSVILLQLYRLGDVWNPPRVLAFTPPDQATDILPTSQVTITFSAPMDRAATERAIAITPRVRGEFHWSDDRTLVFTPESSLPISTTLTVRVSDRARSSFARTLDPEQTWSFTTLARPFLVSSIPAPDAQYLYTPDRVTLTFNRPMQRDSIEQGLVIEPTVQNLRSAWDGNVLRLFGFFQPRTRYQLTLPSTARDAEYQIALDRPVTLTFTTTQQYPQFAILNLGRALTFPAESTKALKMHLTNISRLDLSLYPLAPDELIRNLTAPFEKWTSFHSASSALKRWQIQTGAQLDQYTVLDERLDPLPIGLYYLRVTTPEGASDSQMLVVTDLMLEIEYVGDTVRVRVSNRTDGMPASNVELRLYDERGKQVGEGQTNRDGVFETSLRCVLHDGARCLDRLWVLASHNGDFTVLPTW